MFNASQGSFAQDLSWRCSNVPEARVLVCREKAWRLLTWSLHVSPTYLNRIQAAEMAEIAALHSLLTRVGN